MARPLRMESGVGGYHVFNRGNHRADNCWLAATMHMGNLHEVSRRVSAAAPARPVLAAESIMNPTPQGLTLCVPQPVAAVVAVVVGRNGAGR